MFKKYFYLSVLLLFGCATTHNYQQSLNQWRGKNVTELQKKWGAPQYVARLPNGNVEYIYSRTQLYSMPATTYPTTSTNLVKVNGNISYVAAYSPELATGQVVTRYCRTRFEVNSNHIILNANFQGNNCISNSSTSLMP